MDINNKRKLPPETLLYTGKETNPTEVLHIQYNETTLLKHNSRQKLNPLMVDWIAIEGLKDTKKIDEICKSYNVDPLVVEDILNVNQRNKIELYDTYLFSVQRFSFVTNGVIEYDYISILLFEDKLITFSERNNKFINDIIKRLGDAKSIIRHQKHSYLYYVINDMIVDEKYSVYFHLGSKINELESNLLELSRTDEIQLYNIRKELLFLRNTSNNLHENLFVNKNIIKRLQDSKNKKYYADLKDHIINLREKTTFELDVVNNLYEMHMNNLSHRMNSIMKTLTIFSAIFIPLSFITGLFGMNFTNFAILNNEFGLLIFTGICLIVPAIMIIYFKKKKWF